MSAQLEAGLVTVIIPARDEERFIGACLDSVLAQDERRLQVIVVDGASRDRTPEIVLEYAARDPRVELLTNRDGIIPRSLNLALVAARGEWMVRIDAHSTVPRGYVSGLLRHLETGRWGGVGGRKDGVGVTPAGRAIAAAMGSRFGVGNSTYHYGSSLRTVDHIPFGAYPTSLVRRLGGWEERLLVGQDLELDYRIITQARRPLLFDPALVISWHCRQSIKALFWQYRRYGRDRPNNARLHPGTLHLRHLAAPALVVASLAALALLPVWPLVAALVFGLYALALTAASIYTARSVKGWQARALVPIAFATMHLAWGVGFWEGLFGIKPAAATALAPPAELAADLVTPERMAR
jgi:hypothetical protein